MHLSFVNLSGERRYVDRFVKYLILDGMLPCYNTLHPRYVVKTDQRSSNSAC